MAPSEIARLDSAMRGIGDAYPELVALLLGVRSNIELERAYALLQQCLTGRTEAGRLVTEEEKQELRQELWGILRHIGND